MGKVTKVFMKFYKIYDFVGCFIGFVTVEKGVFKIYTNEADNYDWIYSHIHYKNKNVKFKKVKACI